MKSLILLSATLALTSCNRMFSPPPPPTKEQRQAEFVHCFREEMRPTDEQIKTLQEKIFQNTAAVEVVADELKKATDKLESGLESEMTDSELLPLFHRVGALRAQMGEDHFRRMLMLRSILTPEQRSRFLVCKRKMGPSALPHE